MLNCRRYDKDELVMLLAEIGVPTGPQQRPRA